MLRVIKLPHEEDNAPIALHEGLPLLDEVKDYIESNTKDVLAKLPPPFAEKDVSLSIHDPFPESRGE